MGVCFESHKRVSCCLCGGSENLTGEHKIKASAVRNEFGKDEMFIGNADSPQGPGRYAQSPKSKAFQFQSRLCAACNGARTQGADMEFDRLNSVARDLLDHGRNPSLAFDDPRYEINSPAYLNVFRYFAKLLCCHMAEVGAPRSIRMSRFAIGLSDLNCVWLQIDEDWAYKQLSQIIGQQQYAAHGGLTIYVHRRTDLPHGFHSTLTLGPLRYVFYSYLTWCESLALKDSHHSFCEWVRDQVNVPESPTRRLRLGLSTQDTKSRFE